MQAAQSARKQGTSVETVVQPDTRNLMTVMYYIQVKQNIGKISIILEGFIQRLEITDQAGIINLRVIVSHAGGSTLIYYRVRQRSPQSSVTGQGCRSVSKFRIGEGGGSRNGIQRDRGQDREEENECNVRDAGLCIIVQGNIICIIIIHYLHVS